MPTKKATSSVKTAKRKRTGSSTQAGRNKRAVAAEAAGAHEVGTVLASLNRLANKSTLEGMKRYGIPQGNAFGVPMSKIQQLAKSLGKSHELAAALWETGQYEARMLAAFVEEPEKVTPAQMDRWCRDFDSWAIVDTICFKLFDQVEPEQAFGKVRQWSAKKEEFVRRAGFALLACLALHDRVTGDEPFAACLPLIEKASTDERNFVKKGVSWALRSVGRRSAALHTASIEMAQKFAASTDPTARWLGKDTLRDIGKPALAKKLAGGKGKEASKTTSTRTAKRSKAAR